MLVLPAESNASANSALDGTDAARAKTAQADSAVNARSRLLLWSDDGTCNTVEGNAPKSSI
eukprot:4665737-Amphidinium_carterae.1